MQKLVTPLLLVAAILATPAFAQTSSGAATKGHDDHIVQMRQEIAAARKEYDRKVDEAKKVFNEAKAAAAKERDAAIAAARTAAGQKS